MAKDKALASRAVLAAAEIGATLVAPRILPTVLLISTMAQFGFLGIELLASRQGRKALKRMTACPSMSLDEYRARFKSDGKKLKRELRKKLRTVRDTVDDDVVQPLIRLLEHEKAGTATREELRAAHDLLKGLMDHEFATLLRILRGVTDFENDDGIVVVLVRSDRHDPLQLHIGTRERSLTLQHVQGATEVARRLARALRTVDYEPGTENHVIVSGPDLDVSLDIHIVEAKRLLFVLGVEQTG